MLKKALVVFSISMLLASVVSACPTGSALDSTVTDVSDPGRANKILGDFSTPIIKPGESGTLALNLSNYYTSSFQDLSLTAEIYRYADLDLSKNISKVTKPPVFETSSETSYSFQMQELPSNDTHPIEYDLNTKEDTEEGVYFVRFKFNFEYAGTGNESLMKSKGYFTDSEWENATERPGTTDQTYYAGSINITHLGVNGILPDTSFSVKTQIPRWPQYLLGGLAAFFGLFAVMLYMQEEYNSFPWLEELLDKWSSKLKQLRRRLEYRLGKR